MCQNLVNFQLVIEIQLLNLEFVFIIMQGGFFFCFLKFLVYRICRAILAIIHKRESAKFGYIREREVALDFFSWFFFLPQKIPFIWVALDFFSWFSSCQMVEIILPMVAIHTIVIEKKEEYLRFHLWHSNYVQ